MRKKLGLLLAAILLSACAKNAKLAESASVSPARSSPETVTGDAPPAPLVPEEVPRGEVSEPRKPEVPASEGAASSPEDASGPSEASKTGAENSLSEPRPDPSKTLPELVFRHIGMHIGGESNTAEAKKPFFDAIEKRKRNILLCYREVSVPKAGGTFGIDLRIPTEGGAPEVKKLRHKLGGFEFDSCMHKAFESVRFPALSRPTMVSYSLRFEFKEKRRSSGAQLR